MVLVCLYLLQACRLGGLGRTLLGRRGRGPRFAAEPRTEDMNTGLDAALVLAVGGGQGMAKAEERRVHRSKYRDNVPIDPWDEALNAALSAGGRNETAARRATVDPFARGAAALKAAGGLRRRPMSPDANANDPATFGFVEIGTVVGSHGVRGMCRVDSVSDFGDLRFCAPGIRHMKLPNRRSPRAVVLNDGRRLKVLGAKTRYIVKLDGIDTREAAQALAGALLYVVEDDRAPEVDDEDGDYYLINDLDGTTAYDADTEEVIGTVVDVIDAPILEDGTRLGHSTLEVELAARPRYRCLIPLAEPIVSKVDLELKAVYVRPPEGLLDLAYEFTPPPPFIRGFLLPPKAAHDDDDDDDDAPP